MPEERRWTDASRELVAETLEGTLSKTIPDVAAAVLHALTAAGWLAPSQRATREQADEALAAVRRQVREQVAGEVAEAIEAAELVPGSLRNRQKACAEIARAHAATSTEGEPEEQEPPRTPCPEGFHWLGQPFTSCDRCGLPAWEHDGMAVPSTDPPSPWHDPRWVLEPWKRGEREAVRRRWDRAGGAATPDEEDQHAQPVD